MKRALLVGLAEYPSAVNNLLSPVSDTYAFRTMLTNSFGFSGADIQMLHNRDATLGKVRTGLDWLFSGVTAGDQIVYFQSSHGWRYTKGDTMVEVLCLYDAFLEDHELSSRTQALPKGVLTVALDACHSGGMNKEFFPPGADQVVIARNKVFQPGEVLAATQSQSGPLVTKFKFFGRTTIGDVGALGKQFVAPPASAPELPAAKAEVNVDLNGVLVAACLADETALDGSAATKNLSALTWALTDQLDTTISVDDLGKRVGAKLSSLRIHQTPRVEVPLDQPLLATRTFITMRPAGGIQPVPAPVQPAPLPQPGSGGMTLDDLTAYLRTLFGGGGKEFGMSQATMEQALAELTSQLGAALSQSSGGGSSAVEDVIAFAAPLLAGVQSIAADPDLVSKTQGKALIPDLTDPTVLQNKDWLKQVLEILQIAGPLIIGAAGKDFKNPAQIVQEAVKGLKDPTRTQDKNWVDFVISTVATLTPLIAQAITGQKDFRTSDSLPTIALPPQANDKNWLTDAIHVIEQIIPIALPVVTKFL